MSTIFHVLKEEYHRLSDAFAAYKGAVDKEQQGSPQIKRIGKKNYLYLARRIGKRVYYRYVGEVGSLKAQQALSSVDKRRKYEDFLKGIRQDLKDVKKALRGKI